MDRIVVVTKPTPLDELVAKHHTEGMVRFVLEQEGEAAEPYFREHAAYAASLAEVARQIPSDIPVAYVKRQDLPHFLFREKDFVVAVGPDGLFANLAQYVADQPILGVNPGVFGAGTLMLFKAREVGPILNLAQKGEVNTESLPLARAEVGGKVLWGVNDIYIGRKDKVSSRYELSFDGQTELQSSDGILISTGIGSTGWLRAVRTMLENLMEEPDTPHLLSESPQASDEELVFVVMNPFPLAGEVKLVTGRIVPGVECTVRSRMPRGGYLFSDGIVEKGLEFPAGATAVVSVGERSVQRVIR